MEINWLLLTGGILSIGIGILLLDIIGLFKSNISVMKKEKVRYDNKFAGNATSGTRRAATFGTRLELDDQGKVIIHAESRLSLDSYI